MSKPRGWNAPVATDGEVWLRRIVILQGILPAPLLTLVMIFSLALRGAGAQITPGAFLGAFIAITLFELLVILLWIRARRRARALLLRSQFRICPTCRYSLASSEPAGVCPECGHRYDFSDLRQTWERAYWTGLAPPHLPGDHPSSAT
jgi:hypothetical protein